MTNIPPIIQEKLLRLNSVKAGLTLFGGVHVWQRIKISNIKNPDIANVFYRAGYIEHWGRGIQKICDACKELGAELPRYELIGRGRRVHFKALWTLENKLKWHLCRNNDDWIVKEMMRLKK